MKRSLSIKESLQVAYIIFDKNTHPDSVLHVAEHADLLKEEYKQEKFSSVEEQFLWEWRAFTFAAILHGLSEHAPAQTVVEFLRTIQQSLQVLGYNEEQALDFTDNPFQQYVNHILEKDPKACPTTFFKRYMNTAIENAPEQAVSIISGTMAMLLATSLDCFEKYNYTLD